MTTESLFLEKWKELESATHLSFPTWDGRDMEKFLKKMRVEDIDFTRLMALRNVRNTLAHNPMLNGCPLVKVSDDVIPYLDEVIDRIKHLPTAANILIPRSDVFACSRDVEIRRVVEVMLEKVYSHVPVLDEDGKVTGVFSESTLLEMHKTGVGDEESAIMRDVSAFLSVDQHTAEVFCFVPKNDPIAHLRFLCADALKKGERIGMFIVTENGREDEPLLGILTVWDIAGVSDTSVGTQSSLSTMPIHQKVPDGEALLKARAQGNLKVKKLTEQQTEELNYLLAEASGKELLIWEADSSLKETGYVAWRTRAEELILAVLDPNSSVVYQIQNKRRANILRPTAIEYVEILKGISTSHLAK